MTQLADLIRRSGTFTSHYDAQVIAENLTYQWVSILEDGDPVILPGIGRLVVKETKPRMGRNPKTGELVEIPARSTNHKRDQNAQI